ncbi:hypothetical protein EDD18DRAFT_1363716 [Armillaria luteobubalina]|uniref:Uncharacterized protein n=1 Tax=Armillaria luteobubalina TaxID=153913 RepID=A0AA39PAP2_9AGAR|nr:hypothetical protein EDD18DRAFT_1363716 [Armillaria luteobubalina]
MLPRPRSSSSTASIISLANPDWLWTPMLGSDVHSNAGPDSPRLLIIVSAFLRAPSNGSGFIRSSGEEYNFLVVEALRCGVIINPIPEEQLAQYAAEATATPTGGEEAPFIVSDSPIVPLSPLMPGHASNFSSPNPPLLTPFALPPPVLSSPVRTPSPIAPDFPPQDQLSSPLIPIILPSFPLPSMSPSTNKTSLRPSAPVAGPSNTRKWPLVSSGNGEGANKHTRVTLPPCLTAAQKGKGRATSSGRITTKQGRSRALTKQLCKTAVKGGLGEPTPKDAVEVADPALMPLGLLIPDKDYGDFVGCDGHYFHREWLNHAMLAPRPMLNAEQFDLAQESVLARQVFVPHPALVKDLRTRFAQVLDEAAWIADYQGKVPTALHHQHADNAEQLLGLFELGVKEWKDLANAGDEDFEAEVEDEEENEGEPSGSQEEAD